MKKNTLIAIVDGCAADAEAPDGLQLLRAERFTAVLGPTARKAVLWPQNRRDALQQAVHRQAQLEACMRLGTIMPVRQNAALDDHAVLAFIDANAETLAQVSQELRDAQQFQVTVTWKAADVLSHFRKAPEIAPLFAGESTTAHALETALSTLANRLHSFMEEALGAVARDVIILPVADDVIFNCALLVGDMDTMALDQAVERIDAIWPEGFAIRQIGPAPASSFALLDPVSVSADEVSAAHATLGVTTGADHDVIANARRAALMQPGCDADHIRTAADTVLASRRLGQSDGGFHLCMIRSDGQSESQLGRRNVA